MTGVTSQGDASGRGSLLRFVAVPPFAPPLGEYYSQIYEPAIRKAGLGPMRADAEIFGTGKIMDQVWSGINAAKVLVAELTELSCFKKLLLGASDFRQRLPMSRLWNPATFLDGGRSTVH